MKNEDAKLILQKHANLTLSKDKNEEGFLLHLMNFRRLKSKYLDEIMEALKILSEQVNYKTIDGEVVKDIYCIIFWTRSWTADGCMLDLDNSFTKKDRELLLWWIEIIENGFYYLLNGDIEEAFFCYEEYLDGRRH